MRLFQLFSVVVDAAFTRSFTCPAYEIPIIEAAWSGTPIRITPLVETREIGDARPEFSRLVNDYSGNIVVSCYPGPEMLEREMKRAMKDTEEWLADERTRAAGEHEQRRAEQEATESDAQDAPPADPPKAKPARKRAGK